MLEALMRVGGGPAIMPFAKMIYGQPKETRGQFTTSSGEGGEQGDQADFSHQFVTAP